MNFPDLLSRLEAAQIAIVPDFTGQILRNRSQWFIGKQYRLGTGRAIFTARFADFKNHTQVYLWRSEQELSDTELSDFETQVMELRTIENAERERAWDETALELEQLWPLYSDTGASPYFRRKGCGDLLYGCRLDLTNGPATIVPLRDLQGKLWSTIAIGEDGFKKLLTGGKKRGSFHVVPESPLPKEGKVYLCEGIATAISLHLASGLPVVCAGDAGNLKTVAQELASHTELEVAVCGDDDWGTTGNPGRLAAETASGISEGDLHMPGFNTEVRQAQDTDFNDLHMREGLEAVRKSLGVVVTRTPLVTPGKKKAFSEYRAAQLWIESQENPWIAQQADLFEYNGIFWVARDKRADLFKIQAQINALYGNRLTLSKHIKPIYEMIFRILPQLPAGYDLWQPHPMKAAFLDGTVYLYETAQGMRLEFVPGHRKEDYLITCTPFTWEGDDTLENVMWEEQFNLQFGAHPERHPIHQVFEEQAAAMILARKAHMWFHFGESGRSKSTLTLTQALLMDPRFASHLDPVDMQGTHLHAMVGKQANVNTEIQSDTPAPASFLKAFEDNAPLFVPRKYKDAIHAKLPPTHIYCTNQLPPWYDASKAIERRATLLEYETAVSRTGVLPNFENYIWTGDYGARQETTLAQRGIFNLAKKGLLRLVENKFMYTQPQCSIDAIGKLQTSTDTVKQFLKELEETGLPNPQAPLGLGEGLKMERTTLWKAFADWHRDSHRTETRLGKTRFFTRLRAAGFQEVKVEGTYYFKGIGVLPD